MATPRSILITGASSGIGAALAREYAAEGVTLFLGGRHEGRLSETIDACEAAGARVHAACIEVTDRDATARWVGASDETAPLDLLIANAGISAGTGSAGESDAQARLVFDVNVDGVLNTVHPILPRMAARGAGQIAIMSSLASFVGFAGAPAYCASKAAVRVWGEGLRMIHRPDGIRVSVLCPGFVRSPMTAGNPFPMPGLMSAERAARIIRKGLAANRARIAFPRSTYAGVRLLGALPDWLVAAAMTGLPRKPSLSKD